MKTAKLNVSTKDRAALERLIRGRNTPQKVVMRAKIVAAAADGLPTAMIVRQGRGQLPHDYPLAQTVRRAGRRGAAQGRKTARAQAANHR